jgi:hypothetical protein
MSSVKEEANIECIVHLKNAEQLLNKSEFLIAQALACSQRGERPAGDWEDKAHEVLRLIREDTKGWGRICEGVV